MILVGTGFNPQLCTGQRLCILLLKQAMLMLFSCWLKPVPTRIIPIQQMGERLRLKVLVEAGANKDQPTTSYRATPLDLAAQKGHHDIVRFLSSVEVACILP